MLCQNLVTCSRAGVDWKVVGKYCDVSRSYKTFQNPNDESTSAPKTWRATFLHLLTLPGIIPQSVSKLPGKLWRTVSGREKDMKLGKNFREGACLKTLHTAFHFLLCMPRCTEVAATCLHEWLFQHLLLLLLVLVLLLQCNSNFTSCQQGMLNSNICSCQFHAFGWLST